MTARGRGRQTSLGAEAARLVRELGGSDAVTCDRIFSAWERVVGPTVSAHTTVLGTRRGVLLVGVDSPAWASELTLLADELLDRIQQETGEIRVCGVRFAVTRDVERRRAAEPTSETSRHKDDEISDEPQPLGEDEVRRIKESVSAISDPALREAALRAIAADRRWKRRQD